MLKRGLQAGKFQPGETLIEATSGNTGIALAMVARLLNFPMKLIMPDHLSQERKDSMRAYGAELICIKDEMEAARDLALAMQADGLGKVINQFDNPHNPLAHYTTTGPEIWQATGGKVTHFISSMGTTGTIMGVSKYLKEQNQNIRIIGLQPQEGSNIPGIRRWPAEYMPRNFEAHRVDEVVDISRQEADRMAKTLAREEGICAGVSSGGNILAALALSEKVDNALIVTIICDRGDRYLSTGLFS